MKRFDSHFVFPVHLLCAAWPPRPGSPSAVFLQFCFPPNLRSPGRHSGPGCHSFRAAKELQENDIAWHIFYIFQLSILRHFCAISPLARLFFLL